MADLDDPDQIGNNNNQSETKYEHSHNLAYFQTKLQENYLATRKGVGGLPGMTREYSVDDGVLVDLSLVEENATYVTEDSIENFINSLYLNSHDKLKSHQYLIIGEAGVGKTTLVNQVACDWARDVDRRSHRTPPNLSNKFQLLFALDCKRFKDNMTLEECIQDQLLPTFPKVVIKSLLRLYCNKSLFLFDGFDELVTREQILSEEVLLSSCVIVTTRPNKVDVFNEYYSRYNMMSLEGLSVESRETFVTRYLDMASNSTYERTESMSRASLLIGRINRKYIGYFSFHPLLLAMICIIWNRFEKIPTRMTALYKQALEISAMRVYTIDAAESIVSTVQRPVCHSSETLWLVVCFGCLLSCIGIEIGLQFNSVSLQLILVLLGVFAAVYLLFKEINEYVSDLEVTTELSPNKHDHIERLNGVLAYLGLSALDGLLDDNKNMVFSRQDFKGHRNPFSSYKLWLILSFGCALSCIGMEVGLQFNSIILQLILVLLGAVASVYILFSKVSEDVDEMLEEAVKLNLLTRITQNRSETDTDSQYCFIHKTFQEFTAAVYFTSLVTSDVPKFQYYLKHLQRANVYDLQYFLRFCCGLSTETAEIILEYTVDHCKLDWRLPVALVFEADTDEQIQPQLHDNLKHLTSLETYTTMSSSLWAILNYYLCQKDDDGEIRTWLANVEELDVKIPPFEVYANDFLSNASRSVQFCESIKNLQIHLSHQVDASILTNFLQEQIHLSNLMIKVEQRNNSKSWMHAVFSELLPKRNLTSSEVSYFDVIVPQLQALSLVNTRLEKDQWERLLDIFLETGRMLQIESDDDESVAVIDNKSQSESQTLIHNKANDSKESLDEGFIESLAVGLRDSVEGASKESLTTSMDSIRDVSSMSVSKESLDGTSKEYLKRSMRSVSSEPVDSTEYIDGASNVFLDDVSIESAHGASNVSLDYAPVWSIDGSPKWNMASSLPEIVDVEQSAGSIDGASTMSIMGSTRADEVFGELFSLPLQVLELKGNPLFTEDDHGDVILNKFAESLSYMADLEHLGLTDTGLTTTSMQILGPAISQLSNLNSLDLCTIEDKSNTFHQARMDLSRCLNSFGNLGDFDLHFSDINDEAFGMLSLNRLRNLCKLKVSSNAFGSQGLMVCSISLRHVPYLTKLKLIGSEASEQEIVAFSDSLNHVPLLTNLDLSGIEVELKGLLALGSSLKHLPILSTLKFNASKIETHAVMPLSSLLQNTPLLKHLSVILSSSECLTALALGLLYIPKLAKLQFLSDKHITIASAEALFSNLFAVPELEELTFPNVDTINLSDSKIVEAWLRDVSNFQYEGLVYLRKTDIKTILTIVNTFSYYKESVV